MIQRRDRRHKRKHHRMAFSASAMTVSAPISFNAGAESGDRVSANTSWFALRRRTDGQALTGKGYFPR
jgi:hypothetical protein